MFTKLGFFLLGLAASALHAPALAQQPVYPLRHQPPELQKQDELRCSTWAARQTGVDPARPEFAPQPSAPVSAGDSGVRFRGGFARGAIGARHDAADAAVAGAIIAASTQPAVGATDSAIARRMAIAGANNSAAKQLGTDVASAAAHSDTAFAGTGSAGGASTPSPANAAASAILGYDTGTIVAGGAVAGATVRRDFYPNLVQQQQTTSQQQFVGRESFEKARTECLEARGYTTR